MGPSDNFAEKTLQGFDSGDDVKVCQLSIRADGTVSSNLLNTFSSSSPSSWSDIARPDECAREQISRQCLSEKEPSSSGPRSKPRLEIKQEQDQGPGQHVRRVGRGGGVAVAAETEQTAQNVAELGYIHVGSGAPLADGLKTLGRPLQGARPGPASSRAAVSAKGPSAAGPAADGSGGGERPHLCLQCGKAFRLISSLKKHIRIHTGEKPYPCPVCGRCFRESGALKTHQRIHTGEKPYSCSDCGTSFRHLDGLRKHRRTHTGEKPYVCGVCGKRLSRLQHLKHHQRIHTGERPCRCPRCHKSFKEPAALRKHLRTHREEPGGGGGRRPGRGRAGAGAGAGPAAAGNASRLHHLALLPQMGFGVWGADGEDGVVMNGV
ncbi:hypothetical protein ANANG_G00151250 [Anguilla anguilla]|uniref:C2H2-type domain-containing protein n=1 Tax=Anguilla anguilla TaxID=7936 RepID=A0A9D3M6P7_ANGAN|nr:hypothetical protein ANANG_G00151250 [Anguilla anguilla]